MLTRLRFKNWRSLRDVEIDHLTPLTVFIGANSSGKSNIIDALYFLRESMVTTPFQALGNRGWEEKVRTIGVDPKESIELEITFRTSQNGSAALTYTLSEKQTFHDNTDVFWFDERLVDETGFVWLETEKGPTLNVARVKAEKNSDWTRLDLSGDLALSALGRTSSYPPIQQAFQFITQRWQLLDEYFMPSVGQPSTKSGEVYSIDRCADNVPMMLDFMKKRHGALYDELLADLRQLLSHITTLETQSDDRETRFLIKEKSFHGEEAPTISAGTGRILGILTAFHALNMQFTEQPGLAVIEEPGLGINPLLLENLVELLRNYTEYKFPRQFILTTHNPHLLDYFEPEEVRVVERDPETGETHVDVVPDYIKETWLHKHKLGDAWTSRIIGGIPEE